MTINDSSTWNIKIIAVCAIVAGVIFNGALRVFNIWLSPTGRVLDSLVFAIWVVQVATFILLILSFILRSTKGQDLSEGWKMIYLSAGIYLAAALTSLPIGNLISGPIQQRGYEEFVLENRFLIEAIEGFEAENGRSPETLQELVPNQLAPPIAEIVQDEVGDGLVPKLKISAPYSSIDARSADDVLYSFEPAVGDDPWQLQVSIYLGSFQSTRFIYNPEERYSNRYSKVGRWGLAE
ncbi:MAG: hypothetical protein AB8G95_20930 [Anaerolineae bacterium]